MKVFFGAVKTTRTPALPTIFLRLCETFFFATHTHTLTHARTHARIKDPLRGAQRGVGEAFIALRPIHFTFPPNLAANAKNVTSLHDTHVNLFLRIALLLPSAFCPTHKLCKKAKHIRGSIISVWATTVSCKRKYLDNVACMSINVNAKGGPADSHWPYWKQC